MTVNNLNMARRLRFHWQPLSTEVSRLGDHAYIEVPRIMAFQIQAFTIMDK